MNLWLHLFHGRDAIDQEMDDWGFNGPTIGPLKYVHTTYGNHIKLGFVDEADIKKFDLDKIMPDLNVNEGLVVYQGRYYGDWSVSTERDGGFYRIDVFEGDEVIHSVSFDGTTLEAEAMLNETWNRGPWVVAAAGRYRAVLSDIGSNEPYIWMTIEPRSDDLILITTDEDWIELDHEEEALIQGRLDSAGSSTLLITVHSNWQQFVIETSDGTKFQPLVGKDVEIVVTRIEDGLRATGEIRELAHG